MKQTAEESDSMSSRAALIGQAVDLVTQECATRVAVSRLFVDANRLTIQAHRLRIAAREKQRLAREEGNSQEDLDTLCNQARALMEQASHLNAQALQQLILTMRLRAGLTSK